MKLLLFGTSGQVGWELQRSLGAIGSVFAADRAAVDLRDEDAIGRHIALVRPDVVVNAAAYTNVDGAERDAEGAHAINALAPATMARAALKVNALLVHYSTDYVFDGSKNAAWDEDDRPNPLNAYGRSKLAGEEGVRSAGGAHLILRTSWVYASRGKNFLRTILRLALERETLSVVADQHGAPTSARFIAQATVLLVQRATIDPAARALAAAGETIHLANAGATTWYDFALHACAKFAEATGAKLARVDPISSTEYMTAAIRPANSLMRLDRLTRRWGVHAPSWKDACDLVVAELVDAERGLLLAPQPGVAGGRTGRDACNASGDLGTRSDLLPRDAEDVR